MSLSKAQPPSCFADSGTLTAHAWNATSPRAAFPARTGSAAAVPYGVTEVPQICMASESFAERDDAASCPPSDTADHVLPTDTAPRAPGRSGDQRRAALAQANVVRTARAALKTELKRGAVSIDALISDPPQCLASAKVEDPWPRRVTGLLLAPPGYGPAKVAGLLGRCQVSPKKTFAGLTVRQREALIEALEK